MLARVHIFGVLLSCASLLTASPTLAASRTLADSASQPSPAAASPPRENPLAERERLRKDLRGVQDEIDRLKAAGPGLRNDYVLRARLADAEAIARRLTELDAQIKARTEAVVGRAPAALGPVVGSEPLASPTDGPTELEAKADILTDQARRTQAQAVALQARIDQVRGRLELHRRASALENDPFAPLEGSRRRLAPGVSSSSEKSTPYSATSTPPQPGLPKTGANGPASVTATDHSAAGGAATPPTPAGTASAVQVRDVLDPSASAQVRRNDAAAPVPTDLPSMERQLAALKARAQHLDTQAQALRARARAH
jgi:hypothetical protein